MFSKVTFGEMWEASDAVTFATLDGRSISTSKVWAKSSTGDRIRVHKCTARISDVRQVKGNALAATADVSWLSFEAPAEVHAIRGVLWIKRMASGENRTVMDFRTPLIEIQLAKENLIRKKYPSASADEILVRCLLTNYPEKPGLPAFEVGSFAQQRLGAWRGLQVVASATVDFPELRPGVTDWLGLLGVCDHSIVPGVGNEARRKGQLVDLGPVESAERLVERLKAADQASAIDYVRIRACDRDEVVRQAANKVLESLHASPFSAKECPVCSPER